MRRHKLNTYLLPAFAAILLTGCAGTAPNATKKGFPKASLDARLPSNNRIDCAETADPDRCTQDRELSAVSSYEDYGYREAQISQAREAKRDRERRERGD